MLSGELKKMWPFFCRESFLNFEVENFISKLRLLILSSHIEFDRDVFIHINAFILINKGNHDIFKVYETE